MSKVINYGFVDTPIAGVTELKFTRGLINFGTDFRVSTNNPDELHVVNLTTPIDRPETFRFAHSSVADVYKGTSIDPSVYAPSRRGISILVQNTEIFSVTDTTDADYRVDLPISAHLVLKIPANENITAAIVEMVVGRMISGLYDTGDGSTTRLQSLLRGSLIPSDL